ncbi:hypothetical protein [Acinetobacter sp.]|uniref:hypothetical protein n=1 Tax=Acinetobacter sp. TaxID=472 RepID=UPI0025BB458A|nr:hypothetical protein [Acinetobacter sp.]
MSNTNKVKPLVYPFTFEQWKAHPSTRKALEWCKKTAIELDAIRYGTPKVGQLSLFE